MKYVIDIDGTICNLTQGNYIEALPIKNRIQKINKLYEEGNTIILYTARGMGRGDNPNLFYDLTLQQLKDWKLKYHSLIMGKPSGDIYIDDKCITDEEFFK